MRIDVAMCGDAVALRFSVEFVLIQVICTYISAAWAHTRARRPSPDGPLNKKERS
jgi:hypothetical protein